MPFSKGNNANPRGRPVGTLNLRTQHALELFDKFQFDPLEEKIKLAKSVGMAVVRAENGERLEYRKLYYLILRELMKYTYPQLKAVEHTGIVQHIHSQEELDVMSDVELEAYAISLRAQRALDAGR